MKRKRPYALAGSSHEYREKIYGAVVTNGKIDPFTSDNLRWDLIQTWDPKTNIGHNDYMKTFCLLPTVDHKDPYSKDIEFEICSWLVNSCKNDQSPEEFGHMCATIANYHKNNEAIRLNVQKFYFLPAFLTGICTEDVYLKWLDKRAEQLYVRDRDQGRPYGVTGSKTIYKKTIHATACAAGLYDPYTGQLMKWELLGTWDTGAAKDSGEWITKYKEYYLLPTVDHSDPYANDLELEICSWRINCCKGGLTPQEFVDVCNRVALYQDDTFCRKM